MADSIKISELPELAGVDPDDIVPVVDKTLSQTSRVTAGDIAALGGGPPGDGMVVTSSLADGAVTAAKVGFTGPDKILTRTAAGPGGGVEAACTPFALTLLDDPDQATALQTLGFTGPTFTEPVKATTGTLTAPGYTFAGDENTGIYSPAADTIGFVTGGVEAFRIHPDGALSSRVAGTSHFLPHYGVRAYVNFNGQTTAPSIRASGNVSSVTRLAGPAGNPYGDDGLYQVNFTVAFPDTNYTILIFARDGQVGDPLSWDNDASAAFVAAVNHNSDKQTTHCKVICAWAPQQERFDTSEYSVVILR